MTTTHVLAVVAVSDFDASHRWYEQLFDGPATNVPMPGSLAEFRVTDTAGSKCSTTPGKPERAW